MNVAVKPAVESAELRPDQDERPGDLSSLQESVQVIHHPRRQQHSSCACAKQAHAKNGAKMAIYLANRATTSKHRSLISPVVIIGNSLELLGQSKDVEGDAKVGIET